MIKVNDRIKQEKDKRYEELPEPWNKDKKMSKEYCLQNSISHTGLTQTTETRERRSASMKGKMPKNIELLRSKEVNEKRNKALSGSGNGFAKLTEEKVLDLRTKHLTKNYSTKELAELFNVKECTIYDVVSRRSWKHI